MSLHSIPRLLTAAPVAALLLLTAACGDDGDSTKTGADGPGGVVEPGPVAEDATLAWTQTLEEDWSPTHAAAIGDVVVVTTSWSEDEGTELMAYNDDGSVAWTYEQLYGAALLAPLESGELLICDFDASVTVTADGEVVEEGEPDDERCPVADDEAGIPVPRHTDDYSLSGDQLSVDGPDGSYTIQLEDSEPEIWGVDGGVVTFDDETDQVRLYR